jgi:hypothetical protein
MLLLILNTAQATSADASPLLAPRLIAAGPESGNYAVNPAVIDDPVHAAYRAVLVQGRIVDLDVAGAWPSDD